MQLKLVSSPPWGNSSTCVCTNTQPTHSLLRITNSATFTETGNSNSNMPQCHICILDRAVQVSNITNYALDLLTQAGVELVPFDSQSLNDVSADAWGTGTESYAFEDTDTLARYVHLQHDTILIQSQISVLKAALLGHDQLAFMPEGRQCC